LIFEVILMAVERQVLVFPGEDGYWIAEVPSLPGCISQGATRDEALKNIKEAIELYVEVLNEEGRSIPADYPQMELVKVYA
jgi:predicted RNase H-like HicB family nuclease